MSAPCSDRNLLFGLLALQNAFLSRDALLDAMTAWLARKHDALAVVLQERGALTPGRVKVLEALVDEHVGQHGGDVHKSLAALRVEAEVRGDLRRLGDADVGASVASLAPATVGDWSPYLPPAPAVPAPLPPASESSRYRKLRPHAKGGLGEVHVALDLELGREVALKEIQARHADRADFRARFVREAQITGNLEHPGIVPVHGLGAHPDGRPYYAMRFIRGESLLDALTRFHDADAAPRRDRGEREISLRSLLTRFVAVCNAVAYAHSRGIVHRDLKPANIMLGDYGETLVVDWGLAKVIDQPEYATAIARPVPTTGSGAAPTALGEAVGTPAFMPPEQARGEPEKVDHHSDVWALGATLYCLLTGQPPYQGETPHVVALAARCQFAPARQMSPRVPAALEAVCHKAMAAQPLDRYASARLLAADIERFLADEPVSAHREPLREKARRWARRHRPLVTGAVVLLLASVVGLGAGFGAVRAEQARTEEALGEARTKRSEAEANLTRAVKAEGDAKANQGAAEDHFRLARNVVDDCFGIAKDHPLLNQPRLSDDLHKLKRLLLEKALPFYKDLSSRRPSDKGIRRDVGDQHRRVAFIQAELGEKEQALGHYRDAEAATRQLVKESPGEPAHKHELVRTLNSFASLQRGLGRRNEALANYTEAVAVARRLVEAHRGVLAYRETLATVLNNLGNLQKDHKQWKEARASYTEAISLARALVQVKPGVAAYQAALARPLSNLGVLHSDLGERNEALKSYTEATALRRALVEAHPLVPRYLSDLATTVNNLGVVRYALGQRKEAANNFLESVEMRRRLARAQPAVPAYQYELVYTLGNLGNMFKESGLAKEATAAFTEAAEVARALVKTYPAVPGYKLDLCRVLLNRAVHNRHLDQLEPARADLDEAHVVLPALRHQDPKHPGLNFIRFGLHRERGVVLTKLNKPGEALADWEMALSLSPAYERLTFRINCADARARAGDHDRAADDAAELSRLATLDADRVYILASIFSLCARSASLERSRPLPLRERNAEDRARAAVALLGRAAKAGYFHDRAKVDLLGKDSDLDFLRDRADFRAFVAGLPKPAK